MGTGIMDFRRGARPPASRGALACALALALALALGGVLAPDAGAQCPTITGTNWKNAVTYPDDPFRVDGTALGEPGWIKFVILTCDPSTVYFQDGNQYLFHFDFATNELDPFFGLDLAQFEAVTHFNAGREALLGAVVLPPGVGFPPTPEFDEYGIQLVSRDPLASADVIAAIDAVRAAVSSDPGVTSFYFPTFEQNEQALADAAVLSAAGIELGSTAQWIDGNACYSRGWALGRLKFFAADQIEAAFESGALTAGDILLTDGVPAEIPLVAGVLSLAPATPNAHVAILADTFDIPFAFLGDDADAARALSLVGRRVVLRAFDSIIDFGGCDLRLLDVEDELSPTLVDDILQLKVPPPLAIQPIQRVGQLYQATDGLDLSDLGRYGGKASNFGFLRRSIPTVVPVSMGLSFDLWTDFIEQTMPGGLTLKQEIDAALAPFSYPPADMAAFTTAMKALRDRIEDDAVFTPAQQAAVIAALQDPRFAFDPNAKIRFRSSTNVEDDGQFVGAGLYESKSGCLADELDGDTVGPSQCDPTDDEEDGVFKSILGVYSSFYNDNAVLERLRHGVDEDDVGMAVLVHHNFPDPIEEANGVAIMDTTGFNTSITLVTQEGAVSVTNPEGGAIPEQVDVNIFGQQVSLNLVTSSSLVQLGDTVMTWQQDYLDLVQHLRDAADQFELETGKTSYVLDFEYKFMTPGGAAKPAGGLVVKQIRELPQTSTTPSIIPFLVNQPTTFTVRQGGFGGVLANHRLKASWDLRANNMWLDPIDLPVTSLFADGTLGHNVGCHFGKHASGPVGLPGYAHDYVGTTTTDAWDETSGPITRRLTLSAGNVGTLVSPAESPVLTLADLGPGSVGVLEVRSDWDAPVPTVIGFPPSIGSTTSETVFIGPAMEVQAGDQLWNRVLVSGGVTIDTSYYVRPTPGFCAGCIFPLVRFVETTITGLTSSPIVLKGQRSQSYDAGQHNFIEHFVFEPRLEPGLDPALVRELADADSDVIVAIGGFGGLASLVLMPSDCTPPRVAGHHAPARPKKQGPVTPETTAPAPGP